MTDNAHQQDSRIDLPDSDIACTAKQFVFDVSPAFVAHHSVRSYLFARELAAAKGLQRDRDYDDELVFLSCILHDLGVTEYANGDQRFEVDGADAAASFLRDHGVQEARVTTVWQAIALQPSIGLAHKFGAEQAIAQIGISADIAGTDRQMLAPGFADRVHTMWPRHDVGYALAEVIARHVEANPAKGHPMTFPGHLHHLIYRTTPPVTWFDVVRASGWNDQPSAYGRFRLARVAHLSPLGTEPSVQVRLAIQAKGVDAVNPPWPPPGSQPLAAWQVNHLPTG